MTDGVKAARQRIDHVVALVLENRSFDHLLGDLGRSGALKVDGGVPSMTNLDLNGKAIGISAVQAAVEPDLPHDFDSVTTSLADSNGGFVQADQRFHRGDPNANPARVMSYFAADSLPVTHLLAREYAVSDRWFASVPSGTWPNRLFLVAASSDGRVTNTHPLFLYEMPTVFDHLPDDAWVVYNDQIPNVALIRHLAMDWAADRIRGVHFRSLERFEADCQSGELPAYAWLEPTYLGGAADDSHPPRDVAAGERLLARVYLALRRSPAWRRSMLVIAYDEHGGFFDHVPPPSGVPSPGKGERGFEFTRLGVRVPCLLISPLVGRGTVWRPPAGRFADHTSLMASVLRLRDRPPVTARDAGAADFWDVLARSTARTDDEATAARIEAWHAKQELAGTREPPGPLDPSALRAKDGREVASAIVAHPEVAPPPPAATETRATRGGPPVAGAAEPAADVPFEQALVTLAQSILDLPAEKAGPAARTRGNAMPTDAIKPFAVSDTNVTHVVIELFGGDNNLSKFIRDDMREMQAGNHGRIAMLGLADYANAGGSIVELSPDKGLRVLEKLGEIDTGDPDTLATFLARALVTYADVPHRALGFWDHGTGVFDETDTHETILSPRDLQSGLRGLPRSSRPAAGAARRLFIPRNKVASDAGVRAMLHDDTSGGVLTNAEAAGVLRSAFERSKTTRRFDLIFSDTCLNGMVEVLDEFEPFASVIVGSEELEPGAGWDYERLFRAMSDEPPKTAAGWGRQAVDAYGESYQNRPNLFPCTLAAFRARNTIAPVFADLVKALQPLGKKGWFALLGVRSETQNFARRDSYDLLDFATRLKGAAGADVDTLADRLITEVKRARVRSVALGPTVADATGIAIWFPADRFGYQSTASTYRRLEFDKATGWAEYLGQFLS